MPLLRGGEYLACTQEDASGAVVGARLLKVTGRAAAQMFRVGTQLSGVHLDNVARQAEVLIFRSSGPDSVKLLWRCEGSDAVETLLLDPGRYLVQLCKDRDLIHHGWITLREGSIEQLVCGRARAIQHSFAIEVVDGVRVPFAELVIRDGRDPRRRYTIRSDRHGVARLNWPVPIVSARSFLRGALGPEVRLSPEPSPSTVALPIVNPNR